MVLLLTAGCWVLHLRRAQLRGLSDAQFKYAIMSTTYNIKDSQNIQLIHGKEAIEKITSKLTKINKILINIYLWLPKELCVSVILNLGNLKIKCYPKMRMSMTLRHRQLNYIEYKWQCVSKDIWLKGGV